MNKKKHPFFTLLYLKIVNLFIDEHLFLYDDDVDCSLITAFLTCLFK